jgi:hypothetical protein
MKTLRILLVGLLIAASSLFAVSAKAADASMTLSGVTLSWPAVIYKVESVSVINFTVKNNSGYDLLVAKYDLIDRFGTSIAYDSAMSVVKGGTTTMLSIWLDAFINKGAAPYKLQFAIQFYSSTGVGNPAPISVPFEFADRSGAPPVASATPAPTVTVTATPAPAPTVTVTATPAPAPTVYLINPSDKNLADLVTSLKGQVSLLNAKVKKICAVKPKPKGC